MDARRSGTALRFGRGPAGAGPRPYFVGTPSRVPALPHTIHCGRTRANMYFVVEYPSFQNTW